MSMSVTEPLPMLTFSIGGWCEALKRSYGPGTYRPRDRAEYLALSPYAVNAPALPPEQTEAAPKAQAKAKTKAEG